MGQASSAPTPKVDDTAVVDRRTNRSDDTNDSGTNDDYDVGRGLSFASSSPSSSCCSGSDSSSTSSSLECGDTYPMLLLDTTTHLTNGSSIAGDTNYTTAIATTAATAADEDHSSFSSLWKKTTQTITTTMDSSRVLPMTLLLPKPSTPAQWKASFRASTDDELRSLLVEQQQHHHHDVTSDSNGRSGSNTSNGNGNCNSIEHDLSPLGAELRRTASRIKEYRAMEKAIFDAGADADARDSSSNTTHPNKHGVSSAAAAANVVCFYKAYHLAANHHDDTEADAELIELCLRILKVSSSSSLSLSRGRDAYKRTISASTISISSNSNSGRTHTRGESKTTTTSTNANSNANATTEQQQQPPPIIIPTLSKLRQKLVPSKLKEHVFWESLWVVLYERKKIRSKQAVIKRIEHSANATASALLLSTEKKKQHESRLGSFNSAIAPNERNRIALLEKQLIDSWECISDLTVRIRAEAREREAMEELVEKLWLMMKIQKETSDPRNKSSLNHNSMDLPSATKTSTATKTINTSTDGATNNSSNKNKNNKSTLPCIQYGNDNNASVDSSEEAEHEIVVAAEEKCQQQQQQQQQHTGQWKMSKDSLEFVAFPSEAKEALRTEKQKRLARVNEEMAFILDSDDPKDSRGEWSCCHKANYNDVCGSPR